MSLHKDSVPKVISIDPNMSNESYVNDEYMKSMGGDSMGYNHCIMKPLDRGSIPG
jgi:hypothetical protein